jgi:hypothetical protein
MQDKKDEIALDSVRLSVLFVLENKECNAG